MFRSLETGLNQQNRIVEWKKRDVTERVEIERHEVVQVEDFEVSPIDGVKLVYSNRVGHGDSGLVFLPKSVSI